MLKAFFRVLKYLVLESKFDIRNFFNIWKRIVHHSFFPFFPFILNTNPSKGVGKRNLISRFLFLFFFNKKNGRMDYFEARQEKKIWKRYPCEKYTDKKKIKRKWFDWFHEHFENKIILNHIPVFNWEQSFSWKKIVNNFWTFQIVLNFELWK